MNSISDLQMVVTRLLIAVILVALSGCGGGSGSSTPEVTPTTQNADGIWRGSTVDNAGTCEAFMLTSNGELAGFSENCRFLYKGGYTVNGSNIAGEAGIYEIGGEKIATTDFTGTIAQKRKLNWSYTSPNGDNGTFTATYGQGTDRPSSLELVEGTWSYGNPDGFSASAVIDGQGAISGSYSNDCVFSGVVSLMDPDKTIYSIDFDISQCAAQNGSYDGLATLVTDTATNRDVFIVLAASSDYSVLFPLLRQ